MKKGIEMIPDSSNCNNKEKKKNKKGFRNHVKNIGFTNRLAIYLILLLTFGLAGGLYLALLSIEYNYTGQLLCWTVTFTPLSTCLSIVLGKVVDKNRDENTGGNGDGITFAAAQANNFLHNIDMSECDQYCDDEPLM